jgi:hypothetical protein
MDMVLGLINVQILLHQIITLSPPSVLAVVLIRDFYFSLVVLSFPQLVSFSSFFPKSLSETLRRSSDGRISV